MPPTNVKLQKVIDNREKLQALPPEQAELVANRIFDVMVLPRAGKGLQDGPNRNGTFAFYQFPSGAFGAGTD
jgi:hypothetical protein